MMFEFFFVCVFVLYSLFMFYNITFNGILMFYTTENLFCDKKLSNKHREQSGKKCILNCIS